MLAFGQNLSSIRCHSELTPSELADRAGIPQGVLRRLEEGRVDPPYSLVLRLAAALRTSARYLITHPAPEGESVFPAPAKLRPPPRDAPIAVARATWQAIREEIRVRYDADEPHRMSALELGLTRIQLQRQIQHLLREGMPKR